MFHGIIFNYMKTLIIEEYNATSNKFLWTYHSSSILLFGHVGAALVKTVTGRYFCFAKQGAYLLKQHEETPPRCYLYITAIGDRAQGF